mmetsp:Transcript_9460/g.26514  ORF Transcript_9460/g.26514 Transcript_9460/m.26514 type:complete len:313 (+) Transcript_9460:83-1021(+)
MGPPDASKVPRFSNNGGTFARLPAERDVPSGFDVAIMGVPFDAGCSYRPGARFGPGAVRQASVLLRPYNQDADAYPFAAQQVVDAGDVPCNPFNIEEAVAAVESSARELLARCRRKRIVTIGGDHTMSLPLLRAVSAAAGKPVALVHFDSHLDTWPEYFGARFTHGTPFRRAWEEGLLLPDRSIHVGIHGPIYSKQDLVEDAEFGFRVIRAEEFEGGVESIAERIRKRVGDSPVYLSVDIDVLDPAYAPGTGTPEPGGLSSRELLATIRKLNGLNLVAADVMEVSPSYDHADITSLAAASVIYEILSLFVRH